MVVKRTEVRTLFSISPATSSLNINSNTIASTCLVIRPVMKATSRNVCFSSLVKICSFCKLASEIF